jgi:hypothetical protein
MAGRLTHFILFAAPRKTKISFAASITSRPINARINSTKFWLYQSWTKSINRVVVALIIAHEPTYWPNIRLSWPQIQERLGSAAQRRDHGRRLRGCSGFPVLDSSPPVDVVERSRQRPGLPCTTRHISMWHVDRGSFECLLGPRFVASHRHSREITLNSPSTITFHASGSRSSTTRQHRHNHRLQVLDIS